MTTAGGAANTKVLLHPSKAPALVEASNQVSGSIIDFHSSLGIEGGRESLEARRWKAAAGEVKDKALERGAVRVDAAKRVGNQTFDRARSTTGDLSRRFVEQARKRRSDGDDDRDAEPES
jgi:hypothetical protein